MANKTMSTITFPNSDTYDVKDKAAHEILDEMKKDICIGYDGTRYSTVGDSIRAQVNGVRHEFAESEITSTELINIWNKYPYNDDSDTN